MNKYIIFVLAISLYMPDAFSQAKKNQPNNTGKKTVRTTITPPKKNMENDTITTPSGLKLVYKKRVPGAKKPMRGDMLSVHYTGTLPDGKKFDSSRDRGNPFSFAIGMGKVIKGWDEGMMMVGIGEQATLVVPPHIGYGAQDMGVIPPNSTLIFDVEVMDIQPNPENKPFDMSGMNITTTSSGLKYAIINGTNGRKPAPGDRVTVHYKGKLENGITFDQSYQRGEPIQFKIGKGQVIKGWEEGIALLSVGEKALLIIPPSLGYGARDMGVIPPNSTLLFEVELLDASPVAPLTAFNVAGKDTVNLEGGLKYIIAESGHGNSATNGQRVKVHYTGYLPDGSVFDSSVERNEPFELNLGAGEVIKGWDQGLNGMKMGEKRRLIIPSQLAYGDQGIPGAIPGGATLIFDVEMISAQ